MNNETACPDCRLVREIAEVWITLCAGLVGIAWAFSLFGVLEYSVWVAFPFALTVLGVAASRWPNTSSILDPRPSTPNAAPLLFLLLLALLLLAILLYPPLVHDSLSYRIPRIFMWLQQGAVSHFPATDDRMNYMTFNWELISLPLLQLTGVRLLELPSLAAWLVVFVLFRHWALVFTGDRRKAFWLALIPACSTFGILQAASTMNDLLAASFLLCSLFFATESKSPRQPSDVLVSGLALSLAAGTKPHFAVLALPWMLWFFLARPRPFRVFPWRSLPWLAPLVILLSPLPAFYMNHQTYGSILGPAGEGNMSKGGVADNLMAGTLMLAWQNIQPPVNPLAGAIESRTGPLAQSLPIKEKVPKFHLGASELPFVDGAPLGPIAFLGLIAGVVLAMRRAARPPPWTCWAALAGIVCLAAVLTLVVPATLGRSFAGFLLLAMPLALFGLGGLTVRWSMTAGILSLASACLVLVLSPSHPLWPARTLASGASLPTSVSGKLERYVAFQQRFEAGAELLAQLPSGARLAVLQGGGDPLVQIWLQITSPDVRILPKGTGPMAPALKDADYILLAEKAREVHPELVGRLLESGNYRTLDRREYIATLSRGPQAWYLLQPVDREN